MAGTGASAYLLSGGAAELERLRLQARVWERAAEQLLDEIGITPGSRCLDLGCGGMGILGPLSRRVGPSGQVVGVDRDGQQLAAARAYVDEERLTNVRFWMPTRMRQGCQTRVSTWSTCVSCSLPSGATTSF